MTAFRLEMIPPTGERLLRFVGDRIRFTLKSAGSERLAQGWRGFLRTNLGRGSLLRQEILASRGGERPVNGASWRDIPMRRDGDGWFVELTLAEVGYFKAKAYAVDERGWQVWPEGDDVGVSIHPDSYRTANTIYCAFPRMFGETKTAVTTADKLLDAQLKQLDKRGYSVIPPSGTLRDLSEQLPHIIDTLGCRILHLLPINPTPTAYARFGRFGSPYAGLDLTAIDPALIEFDRRTTGVEQFCELAYAVHGEGARLFLDLVINHTGWSSTLHETHPDWFLRGPDGKFVCPGAWGVTWEDLVELDANERELWDHLAEAFLTWCRRGVDGFRCDAGYKVPMPVWQYITARVREEFPEALFLLEGLGGGWNETEMLLTEGGMQWAYSELFQEFSGLQVAGYLDHALKQSRRVGVLVHYSETHDNDRLAQKGLRWSLLRNQLCALASVNGAFGFTCGVEWLATERILVHGCSGLAWGSEQNICPDLARLNQLLSEHPCFFDGAKLTRLSSADSPVFALLRVSAEGRDAVLLLVNTDAEKSNALVLDRNGLPPGSELAAGSPMDLLGGSPPHWEIKNDGTLAFRLEPGACHCFSLTKPPAANSGEAYRRARAQAAFAVGALSTALDPEEIGPHDWRALAQLVERDPKRFLGALAYVDGRLASANLIEALNAAEPQKQFPRVVTWGLIDRRRVTLVPPDHWLLVRDDAPFRVTLRLEAGASQHAESLLVGKGYVAAFPPRRGESDAELKLERYGVTDQQVTGAIRCLPGDPDLRDDRTTARSSIGIEVRPVSHASAARMPHEPETAPVESQSAIVLLTNGIGGMARLCVDLGRITSKYDCLLGANLHARLPVDRHVFAKRIRVWANVNGFISPLNADNLLAFQPGPPAQWRFAANATDGRTVEIELTAEMMEGKNTTVLRFRRGQDGVFPATRSASIGLRATPGAAAGVRLTVRVDIEDRNFHWETKRNGAAEVHFGSNTRPMSGRPGFAFTPAADRQLQVFADSDSGVFHPQPEWSDNIPHPVEASRGQVASGDAYSPGWFDLSLADGKAATLVVTAEKETPGSELRISDSAPAPAGAAEERFVSRLRRAARAFVVRRGEGKTVIAGYPWFLDWGRDTLICARGLLAAGMAEDVKQILVTFARFEANGTLPNTIRGDDASNRDTSDAPLWFGIVCEELAALGKASDPLSDGLNPSANRAKGLPTPDPRPRTQEPIIPSSTSPAKGAAHGLYSTIVDGRGRTMAAVLASIARNYRDGTPNGIRLDPASALIWSPSHFTWMDTNFPAGTPREGYPVEIQVLWIRLLRQLERIDAGNVRDRWGALAATAEASLQKYFWLEERGYFADLLIAERGRPAAAARADDSLRSNYLLAISLGLVSGEKAQRAVDAALRYLVVPGALPSLAPLPVSAPLPIHGSGGRLLNNPAEPYWGRYEGDEDTRRKPAYHNGTAWTWTFPIFCEALARAWDFSAEAVAAAKAYLGSMERLMNEGCLGQIPEILDGDAPHQQRGCDAQAWGTTEALRVWTLLSQSVPARPET